MKERKRKYFHPIEVTLDVVCGKWKGVILCLLQERDFRFGELKDQLSSVTPKVLTQQLRELEEDGLIARTVYPQVPPKVVYSLTSYGKELEETLRMMEKWGRAHQKKVGENYNKEVSEAGLS
ncbi:MULTISPECIES: winged helix-turn-helix transcriptional regulator [Fictibacillus]|uniref:Helix-turn-helix domain-containing protein n=1 Tax=Fictibacillus terranigra TaxID=3058424 RepID=A0ABT8E7P6_9BACL|nr:helix-turn-helix domain-containing protein [Fictibacillus sp. CENA-BCM004]MDN4073923.1 helix-turn-helix domain-containing protein [Fictibacillus sp. CENA-BCM004]